MTDGWGSSQGSDWITSSDCAAVRSDLIWVYCLQPKEVWECHPEWLVVKCSVGVGFSDVSSDGGWKTCFFFSGTLLVLRWTVYVCLQWKAHLTGPAPLLLVAQIWCVLSPRPEGILPLWVPRWAAHPALLCQTEASLPRHRGECHLFQPLPARADWI